MIEELISMKMENIVILAVLAAVVLIGIGFWLNQTVEIAPDAGLTGLATQGIQQDSAPSNHEPEAAVKLQKGIHVMGHQFSPSTLTVSEPVEVIFTNYDGEAHQVVFSNGLTSPLLDMGEQWSVKITQKGMYSYHCAIHPEEAGLIVYS